MALQSMTALASITLQDATASVSFSGIPQNYRDLVISYAPIGTASGQTLIRLNGDSGSTYSFVTMQGNGSSASSVVQSNAGLTNGGDLVIGTPSSNTFQIMNYSATDKHKTSLSRHDSTVRALAIAHRYPSTSAITSILLYTTSGNFDVGSTFNLYGRIG